MAGNFSNVQANIIQPHGRDYVSCIFVLFKKNDNTTAAWLNNYAAKSLTSAAEQNDQSEKYKELINKGIYTDGDMLRTFHINRKWFNIFPHIGLPEILDTAFDNGMDSERTKKELNDPPLENWDKNFRTEYNAMILLAHDSFDEISKEENKLKNEFEELGIGKIAFIQRGEKLSRNGKSIEHFGYVDSISQPNALDSSGNPKTDFIDKWGGSYLVFRKLKQDVVAFEQKIMEMKNELAIPKEYAEAQIIGRFKDGTPLSEKGKPYNKKEWKKINKDKIKAKEKLDEFNFKSDINGNKCPFSAHIRQVRPARSAAEGDITYALSEEKRIIRRGIPYDDKENGTVGMLFMCYQTSIENQFEYIQKEWCNSSQSSYYQGKVGLDPICGQNNNPQAHTQTWINTWGNGYYQKEFDFSNVVTFLGGEYFYTPALSYLEGLSIPPTFA